MIKVSGHHSRLSYPSCRFVSMFFDGNRYDVLGTLPLERRYAAGRQLTSNE